MDSRENGRNKRKGGEVTRRRDAVSSVFFHHLLLARKSLSLHKIANPMEFLRDTFGEKKVTVSTVPIDRAAFDEHNAALKKELELSVRSCGFF